jgi:hypothetical protein
MSSKLCDGTQDDGGHLNMALKEVRESAVNVVLNGNSKL